MPLSKERNRERMREVRLHGKKNTGEMKLVQPKYKIIGGVRYHIGGQDASQE